MKKLPVVAVFIIFICLFWSPNATAWSPVTHVGQAEHIIGMAKRGDPGIPPEIARVIVSNEKAFKGGALDGDLFNFGLLSGDLVKKIHSVDSASLARELLDSAKTDKEKAYAYGWALVHLPGDVRGHPGWVWKQSNEQYWDYDKSPFVEPNSLHIAAEKLGDWYTLNMFGYDEGELPDGTRLKFPNLNVDIDIPDVFLYGAIRKTYCNSQKTCPLPLPLALIPAIFYNNYIYITRVLT